MIHQLEYIKEEFEFILFNKEYFLITKVINIGLYDTFEQIILN